MVMISDHRLICILLYLKNQHPNEATTTVKGPTVTTVLDANLGSLTHDAFRSFAVQRVILQVLPTTIVLATDSPLILYIPHTGISGSSSTYNRVNMQYTQDLSFVFVVALACGFFF